MNCNKQFNCKDCENFQLTEIRISCPAVKCIHHGVYDMLENNFKNNLKNKKQINNTMYININSLIELEKAWERLSTRAEYAEMYSIESDEFQTIFREFITSVNDIDNYIMEESGFDWDKPFIDWSDVEPVYDWFKECLIQ